jgi:hypothetical protein
VHESQCSVVSGQWSVVSKIVESLTTEH